MYELQFTDVKFPPYDGIQLSGLALFDYDHELLSIYDITNPGGSNPANQGPANLADYQPSTSGAVATALTASRTKWYDGTFGAAGSSTLRITLARPAAIGSYLLVTANDAAPVYAPLVSQSWPRGSIGA